MTEADSPDMNASMHQYQCQLAMFRGIGADEEYRQSTQGVVTADQQMRRIIALCDAMQCYEFYAVEHSRFHRLQKSSAQAVTEIEALIEGLPAAERSTKLPELERQKGVAEGNLKEVQDLFKGVAPAIDRNSKWLTELLDLLVKVGLLEDKLTSILSSLTEIRRMKIPPHQLKSFDWKLFGRELLNVSDMLRHRIAPVIWSIPRAPQQWVWVFAALQDECTWKTIKRRIDDGIIRKQPGQTLKSVSLAINDLPNGYTDSMKAEPPRGSTSR